MKKLMVFITISLLLIGFLGLISAKNSLGITASAINNNSEDGNGGQNQEGIDSNENGSGNQVQANAETQNRGEETELEIQSRIRERAGNQLTDEQIRRIFTYRNRIKNQYANQSECPNNCTCTGSATKCWLEDGTREMTVTAGESGNVIIQVKGVDGTTKVTLYKTEDGKLYAVSKDNETKRIKLLPDQVQEKIREKLQRQLENGEIVLNEQGIYEYRAQKRARLFFIFSVRERVQAELDPETGKLIQVRNPWWGFLAKDEKAEPVLGASCGTVTPGENDACCQNKGYDFWNSESEECEFNAED
ncbi:hypothetical protein A3K82_00045 [Candidatus Pacearchaeota archaeon RBG_19FT_COMBO_34_9]|nr:MAG: hypothetical protein A3K82_00045 [Candidatus Pacearchaeota archaeon RBG_19FT_COMBO_34_9]OGJ17305.1 MAG: hypothetical protein A3K74_01610 [Candidatus Pacearchaeota archaeon RBG_13_33_26]